MSIVCDPEAHEAQMEFYGECAWCNEVDPAIHRCQGACSPTCDLCDTVTWANQSARWSEAGI